MEYVSVYAADVALWALSPRAGCCGVMQQLQGASDGVRAKLAKLANVGQQNGGHAGAQTRRRAKCLQIGGEELGWKTNVCYLGITVDHCVNICQAARKLQARAQVATTAVRMHHDSPGNSGRCPPAHSVACVHPAPRAMSGCWRSRPPPPHL